MQTKAFEVIGLVQAKYNHELEDLGAVRDDSEVWTFPDGSRFRAAYKPLPAFANADMTGYLDRCYFDVLD